MTAFLAVAAGVYGLVIGSFLNVVIYRVPAGQSVVRPPSACPGCGSPIAPRDNIPVFSWVLLRGRCRHCGMRISARYPSVEALTAAVFVAIAVRFGGSWTLPAELILGAGMITLAFVDYDHLRLPRSIVFTVGAGVLAALVVAAAATGQWHRLGVAVACAAVEFALLFAINFVKPAALGFGDVRYGPVLALGLGWLGWRYAFWGFFAANLLGSIVGVALIVAGRAGRKSQIPFGVFLSAGAFLVVLVGQYLNFPA